MSTKKEEIRYFLSPTGEKYPIPQEQDYTKELKRLSVKQEGRRKRSL